MPAELVVDARERDVIAAAVRLRLPHSVETLPLGDLELRLGTRRLLLLERKTADDLAASIQDGRWREQKQRLLPLRDHCAVGYLFEGDFFDPARNHALPPRTLLSAATMAAVRDRLLALRAKDVHETVRTLAVLTQRLPCADATGAPHDPEPVLLSRRERMAAPDAVLLRMLRAVPGVSAAVASALLQRHTSMHDLRQALQEQPNDLARLKRHGSRKALGPAVIQRLAQALDVPETNPAKRSRTSAPTPL